MDAKEIRELFERHKVPLSNNDVWEVRPGAPVVKHSPLERLAAAIGIEWGPPQILRAERDEAVLIATGKIGDGQPEWSIGEACIGLNYKVSGKMQPYPYAMAEKRGKDRVILKLAGLHGAYSEEEADDFKQKPEPPSTFGITKGFDTDVSPQQFGAIPATKQATPEPPVSIAAPEGKWKGQYIEPEEPKKSSKQVYMQGFMNRLQELPQGQLLEWAKTERRKVWPQYGIEPHNEDGRLLVAAYKAAVGEKEDA